MNCGQTPENKGQKLPATNGAVGYFTNKEFEPAEPLRDAIQGYAKLNNLSISAVVMEHDSTPFYKRSSFLLALARLYLGHHDALIFASMGNLSAIPGEVATLLKAARKRSVRVVFVAEDIDTGKTLGQQSADQFIDLVFPNLYGDVLGAGV